MKLESKPLESETLSKEVTYDLRLIKEVRIPQEIASLPHTKHKPLRLILSTV